MYKRLGHISSTATQIVDTPPLRGTRLKLLKVAHSPSNKIVIGKIYEQKRIQQTRGAETDILEPRGCSRREGGRFGGMEMKNDVSTSGRGGGKLTERTEKGRRFQEQGDAYVGDKIRVKMGTKNKMLMIQGVCCR